MPRTLPQNPGPCQAPRCTQPRTTFNGFCETHYGNNRRHGHPLGKMYAEHGQHIERMRQLVADQFPGKPTLPGTVRIGNASFQVTDKDFDRFLRYVDTRSDGSWVWTGKINRYGYGVISLRRGNKTGIYIGAHRLSYELFVGPVPEGLDLDHVRHNEAHKRGECQGGNSCLHRREVDPAGMEPRPRNDNVALGVRRPAPQKDTCKNGHPLSGQNLSIYYVNGKPRRRCKTCGRDRAREEAVRTGQADRSNRLKGEARDSMRAVAYERYIAGEGLQEIADSLGRSRDLIRQLVIESGGEIRARGLHAPGLA